MVGVHHSSAATTSIWMSIAFSDDGVSDTTFTEGGAEPGIHRQQRSRAQ
jgi:hypothetical protein